MKRTPWTYYGMCIVLGVVLGIAGLWWYDWRFYLVSITAILLSQARMWDAR